MRPLLNRRPHYQECKILDIPRYEITRDCGDFGLKDLNCPLPESDFTFPRPSFKDLYSYSYRRRSSERTLIQRDRAGAAFRSFVSLFRYDVEEPTILLSLG